MSRVPRYERYLFHPGAGTDPVFSDFTDSEWRCYFGGVLVVAAKSPIRGWLFLTELIAATPENIARVAGVRPRVGRATVAKATSLGLVEHDSTVSCDRVVDFDLHNPAPKADSTNAERQRRYRARQAEIEKRNAVTSRSVTEPVTPGIEEKRLEEKKTPLPPVGVAEVVEALTSSERFDPLDPQANNLIARLMAQYPDVDPLGAANKACVWSRNQGWRTKDAVAAFDAALRKMDQWRREEQRRDEHKPTAAGMVSGRDTCLDCGDPITTGTRCRDCDHKLYERKTGEAA